MEKLEPSTEEFMGAVRDLRSAVMDHVAAEESYVFPFLQARQDAARLALLGKKFRGEKLAAPTRPHPHLPN
jgi:hemerythrin superfamily protein